MRSIAVTLSLACLTLSAQGQNMPKSKTDLKTEGLKGRVATVITRGFRASSFGDGPVVKGGLVHTTTKSYSPAGYLLESHSSIGGQSVGGFNIPYRSARIVYKYDGLNNLLGSVSYNTQNEIVDSSIHHVDKQGSRIYWQIYKANGVQEWEYISEYDNGGNLLETNDNHFGKLETRHVFRYNDMGKCISETTYAPDLRVKSKTNYKYDDRGNRTEEEIFNGDGSYQVRRTFKYDDEGHVIEQDEYKIDNSNLHSRILTSYDFLGNVEEIKQYDEYGKILYYGKFDRYGNHLSDITYNPDGGIREKVTASYRYDEFDNEVEEVLQLSEKIPAIRSVSKYEYDYPGNWVRKTVFEDGVAVRIAERDIEYYK